MSTSRVIIELQPDLSGCDLVLTAGLHLSPPDVELGLVLRNVDAPTPAQVAAVTAACSRLAGARPLPSTVLLGHTEALDAPALARVVATSQPVAAAKAVASIAAAVTHRGAFASGDERLSAELADRDERIRFRDSVRRSDLKPVIAVVAQVQSTWGSVDAIVRSLRSRTDTLVEVVAVESDHEERDGSTSDFIGRHGYTPRGASWLQQQAEDLASPLTLALYYDPWDNLRPYGARSTTLDAYGVRLAYVPYGTNVGGGRDPEHYAYDLPIHRAAQRVYARSTIQKEMFKRHCRTGDAHVRVMGVPKFDRSRATASTTPSGPPTVLWNPHFSIGPGGWSTFTDYASKLIHYAKENPDFTLVVRPHFRLMRDANILGGAILDQVSLLIRAAESTPNIELDLAPDYLESFRRAHAMISDLSSLIPEFLVTEKPLLYLHRIDSPGVNADSTYFFECPAALEWPAVAAFLDDVRSGRDVTASNRRLLLQRHFEFLDGESAQRIAADLATLTKRTDV